MNRREFLKLASLGLGAVACRFVRIPSATPTTPRSHNTSPSSRPPTQIPTGFQTPTPPPQSPTPDPKPATSSHFFPTPVVPTSFLIDAHQDIAWNALEFGRDPLQSAIAARGKEDRTDLPALIGQRTAGLPEYLAGHVGLVFATLFVMPSSHAYASHQVMTYNSPRQAAAHGREELKFYQQLETEDPHLRLVLTKADLQAVVSSWTEPDRQPMVGFVLLMEGADPILAPGDVKDWYQQGLRLIGPAWAATQYAGGTGEPGPLTPLGRQLLAAMAELSMVLDLSHMAPEAYLQAVDTYPGPIIASHSNPHRFLPTDRGLTDTMIKKLVARDGVIGITPYNRYLTPGWKRSDGRSGVTIETFADAIDVVVQLAGDAHHVGVGSDLDGGFGLDALPQGIDSAADLIKIGDALAKRGYAQDAVDAVLYANWLRILNASLP